MGQGSDCPPVTRPKKIPPRGGGVDLLLCSGNSHLAQCRWNVKTSKAQLMKFDGLAGELRFTERKPSVQLAFQ